MLDKSRCLSSPRKTLETAYLESLVREDYDWCHPNDSFDDMKRRTSFSKEDQGLYRDWMALAALRAAAMLASKGTSFVADGLPAATGDPSMHKLKCVNLGGRTDLQSSKSLVS